VRLPCCGCVAFVSYTIQPVSVLEQTLTKFRSWLWENETCVRSKAFQESLTHYFRYSVIELLSKEDAVVASPAPIAFFYCVRAEGEPERADPDEILRCIVKQLCFSKSSLPIREPVASEYKRRIEESDDNGCNPEKLSVTECEDMILGLLEKNPATIIIDALDECDSKRRHQLMRSLDNIIQKSASLVKIFVSSREDNDIVCNLEGSPNILIDATDNARDIERFIYEEVDQAVLSRRLIGGRVSEPLKAKIIQNLLNGAQGM
jgi:hypothetical protein